MRKKKPMLKRAIALLMSLLLLFSSMSVMPVVADSSSQDHAHGHAHDNLWAGTTGSLVADNYDELNDYEKAILGCTALVGGSYVVEMPTDDTDGLVSVDADAQTVTAKPYTVDGFVWTPTAAVIKYNNSDGTAGTDVSVTLTKVGENYVGTFQKPANSYRVEVTYSLYIEVDADLQELLLNTPYYLVDGYIMMNDAADGSLAMAVSAINEKMEELRMLYNGIKYEVEFAGEVVYTYTLALSDTSACKLAIGNLIADYDANGGSLTLAGNFADYMAATSKVQYMLENGAEVKENIKWFYTQLANINANSDELLDMADELENIASGTGVGTVSYAKETIDTLVAEAKVALDDKIQSEIVEAAIKKAQDEYGLDISSLRGKTRENDAIYNEIDAKRVQFEEMAQELEALADVFESIGNASQAATLRQNAEDIRTIGLSALDTLEDGIREAYALGDEKIAELEGKKADLDDIAQLASEKADECREIVTGEGGGISLRQVVNTVRTYNNQKWEYLGKKIVKDTVTADEYAKLDAAVKGAIDPIYGDMLVEEHSDIVIKDKLLAEQTVITALVEQCVVYIDVNAQVVPKSSENSATLMSLNVVGTSFPLDKGTTAASILAAITDSGIEENALSQWDSYYNINTSNYNRTVTVKDSHGHEISLGDLTGDVYYSITYTPKTLTIDETYKAAGSNITSVPYGYNWRLPRPTELSKSYDYEINGVSVRENTVFRVIENISVSRSEGKAISAKNLAELLVLSAIPGEQLSEKEINVLSSNAFSVDTIYFRTPDSNDKLTKVTISGEGYKLEAQTMSSGILGSDAEWVPVSAYPVANGRNGATIDLTENNGVYEGYFTSATPFTSVKVIYELKISSFSAAKIAELVNIADVLVAETASQKATLDDLCNKNNFYGNLGQVTSTVLGSVGSVVSDITPAAKAALNALTSKCINPVTGLTYLYEYLTQYKSENGGLAYYYKGNNAENIKNQIDLVNQYLPILWNDAPVQDYINSMPAMAAQADKIEAVMDQLNSVQLLPVNALVNTDSAYIDNLLASVTAAGTTSTHVINSSDIVLRETLSAVAPGQTAYGVEIQVLNKNDGLVKTYKVENFRAQGSKVTVAEFEALYAQLLAQIPNNQYYVAQKNLPTADVILTEDAAIYTNALRPVAFTVKIEGEADQTVYAFDAYTITLPGTGNPGLKYVYTIGNTSVEVLSGATENFALATDIATLSALFGADRQLVITRKLVDTNKENLINFINKLNVAFANSGLTFGNNLAIAFIPMEDADGNLSVVIRTTSNFRQLQPKSLAGEMANLIQDISYVGLNGNPLLGLNSENELKLYIQTIINAVVNSGIGFDALGAIIETNGNIREMKLPAMSAIGAVNNTITVSNGKVINSVNELGGKLAEFSLQYGVNINNATSVPVYVTYQDFDTQTDLLRKAKKGINQILPYGNINCSNGAVNLTLNAPDSVYAYMITALLITGKVEFSTIQSYDLSSIYEYMVELIDPMFENENIDPDSVFNTADKIEPFFNSVKKTGLFEAIDKFDTDAHKALMELVYDSVDHLYDCIDVEGSSEGGLYKGIFTYDALEFLMNKNIVLEDYKTMIAELETGLSLPVNFNFKNRDAEYEALILDVRADGITNKYRMARKASTAIAQASDDAIIVLLSDIRGDITFNSDVILNLNGYTINGNLTAKGSVNIVDSTLSTKKCGNVTGELIADGGTFRLVAGKYLSGAEKYVAQGYSLVNNVVTNGCFNLVQNGTELNVYLNTDYLSLNKSAAKSIALDLVSKLLMNYYACCELVIDGNTIYNIEFIDVTDSLDSLSDFINEVIDILDCEGTSTFATQFITDITDFAAIADAIDSDGVVASYTIQNAAFNPFIDFEDKGDDSYFSFNLTSSADKKITKLNVLVSDEVPVEQKVKMSEILRELDVITTFNELLIKLDDIKYANRSLSFEGSAVADVEIDLSNNINYPVIVVAILAADATGTARAELIDAILDYQNSGSTVALKNKIESMTLAQLLSALENTGSKSFASILSSIGVSAPEAVDLESLYTIVRKAVGAALRITGVDGNGKTFAGLKLDGTYGDYGLSYTKSNDTYGKIVLKLFTEDKDIVVKDKNGITYITTDDILTAIANLTNGATMYVNSAVVLPSDVVLPAVSFTIERASNIDFDGNIFWIEDANTVLLADEDITANVSNDTSVFCSAIEHVEINGFHQYRLVGDQHEWEDIPAVAPGCDTYGSTAGVWCKHCHKYQDGKVPQPIDPIGHDYSAVVTAPTCTEEGYTTYTCGNCGDVYVSDYVDATNHEGTTVTLPAKPATCTEDGLTEGLYCSKCNTVLETQKVIPAKGHSEEIIPAKPATCTENGFTEGKKCSVCGVILVAPQVIPAGHTHEIIPAKPATCTEDGLTEGVKCSVCGEILVAQEVIPAAHKPVAAPDKAPTCTEDGYSGATVCSVCGEPVSAGTVIPATGHTTEVIPGKEATCTETGLTEGLKCSVCGEILIPQSVIPAKGHAPEIIPGKSPTCTEDGLTDGLKCSVCGEILIAQEVIPAAHTPVAAPDKAPTCTEDGYTGATVCSVCGEPISAGTVIPATGHTTEIILGKPATCTEDGLTDGAKCSVCGEILIAQTVISATGHAPEVIPAKPATCTEDGLTEGLKCSVCGEILVAQEVIPAAHKPVAAPDKAPTCTEDGISGATVCSVCGEPISAGTVIPATGHTTEIIPGKPATCTEDGLTDGAKCSVCGEILIAQTEIPATGHTTEVIPGKAPTCTEDGLTDGAKCSICGEILIAQEVIPAAHKPVAIPDKAPTCTEDGLTGATKCSVCGEIINAGTVIPATGHTIEIIPAKNASCTETGLTEGLKCSVCGEILVAQEVVPITHDPIPYNKEATCTEAGVRGATICSICDRILDDGIVIPARGHKSEIIPGKAPTCTEEGLTEGLKCSVCDEILIAQEVIPAAHTPVAAPDKEPTCTENGVSGATVCSVCGEIIEAGTVIPVLGHTEEIIPAKAPTCTEDGLTEGVKCSVCGEILIAQEVIPAAHTPETIPGKEATCTESGLTEGVKCSVCGEILIAQEVIPAKGHSEEIIPGKAPTCTEDGLTEGKKCSVCGEITVAQQVIPAAHTPVANDKAPTCTEEGTSGATKCSVCGEILSEGTVVPALGHTEEIIPGKEATCTENGLTEGKKCSVCGEILVAQEIIPAGHKHETIPGKDATCTEDGLTEGVKCSVCGEIIVEQEVIPAAHTPEAAPDKEPTCTEEGISGATVCSVCGETIDAGTVIPELGHKHETIPGQNATCTESGLTEGVKCSVCGEIIVEQEVIPALGHTEETIPGYAATCTEEGLTDGTKCSVCGEIIVAQEVIPALGHTEETIPGYAATCTEEGLTDGTKCSVCGEIIVAQEVIPALGHTEETIPGYAATCTEEGLTDGTKCSVCGEILIAQEVIPAKGHGIAVAEGKPATCTEDGLTAGAYCPECNHVHVAQKIISALGHDVVTSPAKAPTCTETGLTEGSYCARCGEVFVEQQVVPMAEHTIVVDEAVAPTATATGLTEGSHCSVCGKVIVEQKVLAKLPYIHVPTVKVEATDGIIRGAKVDATNKYIFLDVNPDGFTVSQFADVYFKIDNATTSKQTLANYNGSTIRGANDLVCTGDTVTVWAANEDGAETSVTYHIIIMGDANCDGKLNARDVALMKLAFVGDLVLEGPGALAADMNFDGKLNARDTVACETKYVLWSENEYVSQTK